VRIIDESSNFRRLRENIVNGLCNISPGSTPKTKACMLMSY